MTEGKYIYCIIGGGDGRTFGPIGIGGRGDTVCTLSHRDLSAVISNAPMTRFVIDRENLTAHERVIEKVMRDTPAVLPVRFCTIAASAEEIRDLLRKRYVEFKHQLQRMDNKIELGLKVWWKDLDAVFAEIHREDSVTRGLRENVSNEQTKVKLGRRVKDLLEQKRSSETERLIEPFKRPVHDFKIKETHGDAMVLSAVFLVDRGREGLFDRQVEQIDPNRYRIECIGPAPVFHFVDVEVKWT